ncbi:MAG: NADH-quinone oxidoreductase subunit NuoF [Candidatus Eremiobacteraeota bacterium]|nr:NADH-quinone oxidoreductase subunit NuoF [Candidatus Eremiobacteraeota bacterium]
MEILVGTGTCGISAGALKVLESLKKEIGSRGLDIPVRETGCMGMCYCEVLVEIRDNGKSRLYGNVNPKKVLKIVEKDLIEGQPIDKWIVKDENERKDDSFFARQKRIVLRNCGDIDPSSIEDYIANDGYKAIEKVLLEYKPDDVIEDIKKSGLRGRGGAGFPTGLKWSFAQKAQSEKKYIICNADEGDPGAFMDRSVLEGDPHSILEGMLIAAYAIGASEGYIYVRAEYPLAIKRLQKAIKDAKEKGFLGKNILGSDFSLKLKIKEGAGAFVCGEETALMASIEGHRGMPRIRPPFPANSGLWGHPTNINNVETFANVPWIILNGGEAYANMGVGRSRGTKVFAIAGKAKRAGLIEVEMGIPLREIIFDICDGIAKNRKLKALQMGGPSGGCIPVSLIDTVVDYESITKTGAIMGSGGIIVIDDSTCMVELARFFLSFTQNESCGKCVFCRIGTKRMLEILEKITKGKAEMEDLETLEYLAYKVMKTSLCGLGQTAPNPVLTTLKYFREEYEAHIADKKCPAGQCADLISFRIIPEKCIGCGACIRACPVEAISGEKKQIHKINPEKCIKCGKCLDSCKFEAVVVE